MPLTSHRNILGRGGLLPDFHNPDVVVGSNPSDTLGFPGGLQRKPELYILALISRGSQAGCSVWTPACEHLHTGEHICAYMHTHRHSVATAFEMNSSVGEHHMCDSGWKTGCFISLIDSMSGEVKTDSTIKQYP